MEFQLHPNLANKTVLVTLPLCLVLLQDEANYPWLILVPQRANVTKIMDLSQADQQQLMRELDMAQRVLQEHFTPTNINVAALGNKLPQLHLHVLGRFSDDPAWPATVWDHPLRTRYLPEEKQKVLEALQHKFGVVGSC